MTEAARRHAKGVEKGAGGLMPNGGAVIRIVGAQTHEIDDARAMARRRMRPDALAGSSRPISSGCLLWLADPSQPPR